MRKEIFFLLSVLSFFPSSGRTAETRSVDFETRVFNSYSPFRSNFSGGASPRVLEKLNAALANSDALIKAVSGVLINTAVSYVPLDEWETKDSKLQEGKIRVTVNTLSHASAAEYDVRFSIWFDREVESAKAKEVLRQYLDLIAPDIKKLSERLFTENFEPAMQEAKKALDVADAKVNQLEGERRHLQLRSYEELPYEKVADHLADLQRQYLVLKLSLVGIDAKKNEIERQKTMAEARLKDQASRAAKEASSNEIVDALKQLVALREKNAERLKELNKAGMAAAQSEIDDAGAKVLETKIQLFTLQGKKPTPAQNDQLETLQAELTRLAIDRSEQQARLDYLEHVTQDVSERIAKRADLDQNIKRIDDQLPTANVALRSAQARIKELEEAKTAFKPIDLMKTDN
jgi:DNA repair exonuclease SbcCD ATPase subunit